ncbi:MAG TPA: DNA-binding protein [Verrucomicrobiales bacterium]|nr:DNA-binding protein [Verrucomicrobiales bacterium]
MPFHDQVCFHCQQSAEKCLKAAVNETGIFIPKTHDLLQLLGLLTNVNPAWAALSMQAGSLTVHAVRIRSPCRQAGAGDAKQALANNRSMSKTARKALGL